MQNDVYMKVSKKCQLCEECGTTRLDGLKHQQMFTGVVMLHKSRDIDLMFSDTASVCVCSPGFQSLPLLLFPSILETRTLTHRRK